MMISVTILTFNAARHLRAVLEAVRSFDEVILLDSGSTDQTASIANHYANVRFISHTFNGFGEAHQKAAELALHDWILSIDADEILSPPLIQEIQRLSLNPNTVYDIPFHNIFRGRWIKWCGWHPESHVRLYHRRRTGFSLDFVHERVLTESMTIQCLKHPIYHHSYETFSDFLIKMERYSTLFAKQYGGKRKATLWTAISHSFTAFFKSYVLKRGFLGGLEGFVISVYNAHTTFYKYLKLYEYNASTCVNVSQSRRREACELSTNSDRTF